MLGQARIAPGARINDAMPGRTMTIVGVVPSESGFIDSEGRRVIVQDNNDAILVRYPTDGVARRCRATPSVPLARWARGSGQSDFRVSPT